jgi:transposase
MRHGLTDEQWDSIAELFPEPAATGRPPADPRKMLEAMIWINNTGAKWRDLPRELGAWQTVFKHFDRWNKDGTLEAVVSRLTQLAIDKGEVDSKLWCIDGSIVRAHRCAAGGAKKGRRTNHLIMH